MTQIERLPIVEQLPDPYPLLGRLREFDPVHQIRLADGREAWLVSRYDDVRAGLADPRLSNDPFNATLPVGVAAGPPQQDLISSDPPVHTRLRRLVAKEFTARRCAALRPRIQQLTDDLLAAIAPQGKAELVADFAYPLPVAVICELLGVPPAEQTEFRELSAALMTPVSDEVAAGQREQSWIALHDYLRQLIARKRATPGDDLLTALAAAQAHERLTENELIGMALILLVGGHESTVGLIATGILRLLEHPDQLAKLRGDPGLLAPAIEELLRYDGPMTLGPFRYAKVALDIGGVRIPKGALVFLSAGAANRDGRRFEHPDRLDLTRQASPHLGFGHGIHYCLGAPLARIEAQVAIGTLIQRLPQLALAVPGSQLVWRPSVFRGVASLPVTF
jgi:cytochrome P450